MSANPPVPPPEKAERASRGCNGERPAYGFALPPALDWATILRTMGGRSRRDVRPDPEALLSGREVPTPRRLLEAIHAVNPTGRDLPSTESVRRYALKGRLQSALIELCPTDLEVQVHPTDPSVVGLRHRYLDLDACHATLDGLTDAARAWVQFQIDTASGMEQAAGDTARRSPRDGGPRATQDALAAGRVAMESYDYDAAREHFLAALGRTTTEAAGAVALLELLVDHLAADEEALALEGRLSAAVGSLPGTRALLASAAARSGDVAHARRLLRGLDDPRAADAWTLIARHCVTAGDMDEARRIAADLHARAPGHPSLPDLERVIAEHSAEARQPVESAAAEHLGRGELDAAESLAREALARWGDSAPARAVLREVRARRQRAEAEQWRARLIEALATGSMNAAEAAVQRLSGLGEDTGEASATVALARRAVREAAVEAATVRIVAVLRDDVPAGVRAWTLADPEVQSGVRARAGSFAVDCAAEAVAHGVEPGEALVAAVLALGHARERLAVNDAEEALSTVQSHMASLSGVHAARQTVREARRMLAERQRAVWERAVFETGAALDRGDGASALAILAAAGEDMVPGQRAAVKELRQRAEALTDLDERSARIATLESEERWLEARDALDELCKTRSEAAVAAWQERRAAITHALRAAWRVQTWSWDSEVGEEEGTVLAAEIAMNRGPPWRRLPSGDLMHMVDNGRWLVLLTLDPTGRCIRRRTALYTPQPLQSAWPCVLGRHAWLVGRHGQVLSLDLDADREMDRDPDREMDRDPGLALPEIRAWRDLRELMEIPDEALTVFVVEGRYLWVSPQVGGEVRPIVIDLVRWRIVRTLPGTRWISILYGCEGYAAAASEHFRRGMALRCYTARGEPAAVMPVHPNTDVVFNVGHPDGRRLVVFDVPVGEPTRLRAFVANHDVAPSAPVEILMRWEPEAGRNAAVSRATGLVYFHTIDLDVRCWLVALEPTGNGVVVRWRVALPGSVSFVEDNGDAVTAVFQGDRGVHTVVLGTEPPVLDSLSVGPRRIHPKLAWQRECHALDGSVEALRDVLMGAQRGPVKAVDAVRRAVETRSANDVVDLILGSARMGFAREGRDLTAVAWKRFPDHPQVRLLAASTALSRGSWDEALQLLAGQEPTDLPDRSLAHWWHVKGVAHLRLGDPGAAYAAWTLGLVADAREGACGIRGCLDLVAPIEEATVDPSEPGTLLRAVRWAVHTADRCMAHGDATGARSVMHSPEVAVSYDLQGLARWASAWLETPTVTPGSWTTAMTVISAFAAARSSSGPVGPLADLSFRGATWDAAQLDVLAARCNAWLDTTVPPRSDGSRA